MTFDPKNPFQSVNQQQSEKADAIGLKALFAAHALQGLLANAHLMKLDIDLEEIVEKSEQIAEAMRKRFGRN